VKIGEAEANMVWQFSRTRKHSSVILDPGGHTATLNSPTQLKFGKSVLLAAPLPKDPEEMHQWSIRIENDKVTRMRFLVAATTDA